jgi:hypothetical protein
MSKGKDAEAQTSGLAEVSIPTAAEQRDQIPTGATPAMGKEELEAIETLAAAQGIDGAIFAGVVERERWATGKRMTAAAFSAAVAAFLAAPASGR